MDTVRICSKCGTALRSFAPEGLCGICLLNVGFEDIHDPDPEAGTLVNQAPAPGPVNEQRWKTPGRFADYELLEEIAHGGMGVIYKARQISLSRMVALKMVRSEHLSAPAVVQRFKVEAEAAAKLDHPNIVPIYDIGVEQGQHYFSMRLIEGVSLAEALAGEGEAPDPKVIPRPGYDSVAAARLMTTVARAVHYAHQRGVLHRDLKPGNILLDWNGQPYVTDFGLAKLVEKDSSITQSEVVMGTASYMAPEQAAGRAKQATTAADVYSLGAVLYELMSGRPPFRGEISLETMRQILETDPPRPRTLNPRVDRDLEIICLKCLEKEPAQRYSSAEALATDLEHWLRNEPIVARPGTLVSHVWKWVRRKPVIAGLTGLILLLLVTLAIGSTMAALRIDAARSGEKRQRLVAEANARVIRQNLYAAEMKAALQAWYDDNVGVVIDLLEKYRPTSGEEDLRGFEWRHLWSLCHQDLTTVDAHPGSIAELVFSPDGNALISAGGKDRTLKFWDTRAWRETQRIPGQATWLGSLFFLPDQHTLALDGNDGRIRRIDPGAHNEMLVLEEATQGAWPLRLSPNGRWVAAVDFGNPRRVCLWDATSGLSMSCLAGITFPDRFMNDHKFVFSPDSQQLAISCQTDRVLLVSIPDLRPIGELPLQDVGECLNFSPDGKLLAVGLRGSGAVQIWEVASRSLQVTLQGKQVSPVFDVRFSPDQKTLASSCLESAITLWDLAERREAAIFKGHAGQWISISFSPDSKLLVSAGQDGKLKVWNAALKKPTELESVPKNRIARLALSPDSRHIALWSFDAEILLFETHSGKLRNRWAFDGGDAVRFGDDHGALSFSSDGRLLAASHDDTVRIIDVDSERLLHNLVGGSARVVALSFAPGSDTLAAASDQTIRVWNARSGVLLEVIRGSGGIRALSISPDGSAIAFGGFIWGDRNKLTLWDRELERPSLIIPADGIGIRAIAFSPDGQTLAFGTGDGELRVWDIAGGQEKIRLAGHRGPLVAICFSSDGKNLITASIGGSTTIWQLKSFREVGDLTTRCKGIHSAGLSTDANLFLLGSRENGIQFFRADPFERTDAAPAPAQE